ncbi:MAG TPA: WXG100 family type VII secretion target [Solirubrobacteraceae bacterium]|nr:WXG100 family type VII secretion target [Solirubrobacteraceae bacterium]
MSQYSVAPESVQAAGRQIQMISADIEALIGRLRTTAMSVHSEWTGAANGAFENAMNDWNVAATRIQEASNEIGVATQTAGTNYAVTESNNTRMFA